MEEVEELTMKLRKTKVQMAAAEANLQVVNQIVPQYRRLCARQSKRIKPKTGVG